MKFPDFKQCAILLAALAVAGWAGEAEPMGVEVDGEKLAVIDMHLHTGTWAGTPPRFRKRLTDRVPTGFKWTMGVFMNNRLDGESILSTLDDAGISAGAVFALWSPATTGIATNDHVAKQVAVNPDRLFGFASLRVDHWNLDGPDQLRQMEEAIEKHGMVGIKLAHGHQQVRLDDERLYGVYEIAARQGTPIYLHTGTSPNPGTRTEPAYCDSRLPGGGHTTVSRGDFHTRPLGLRQFQPRADPHRLGDRPRPALFERVPGTGGAGGRSGGACAARLPGAHPGGRRDREVDLRVGRPGSFRATSSRTSTLSLRACRRSAIPRTRCV